MNHVETVAVKKERGTATCGAESPSNYLQCFVELSK